MESPYKGSKEEEEEFAIDDWLDQFEMFSIYEVLPKILAPWVRILSRMLTLKKLKRSSREMTTPLFLLHCLEIGLSIRDLDYLTIGMLMDIWTEKGNDSVKYDSIATQRALISFGE